jgi:PAS domain S-box-containing protein
MSGDGVPRGAGAEARERETALRRGAWRERESRGEWGKRIVNRRRPGSRSRRGTDVTFRPLADSVRDYAIFLMDPAGVITYWGKGAQLMKWWTREQVEGAHLRLLYPDGGAQDGTAEDHLRIAAERGEYVGEGERVRSDGSTFWASVTLTALRDEEGTLLGFTKVTRDLTARRGAEAALAATTAAEQARAVAEEANKAKTRLIATMSHEIRTPINAVLGYVGLLEDAVGGGTLTATQRHYLERLRLSGQHLATLIDEILDLSRLEADRVEFHRTTVRLGDVVAAALALVEPQARARSLVLANEMSATAADQSCCGDEQRLRQILINVLANAIKFTEGRNGTAGRVTVSAGAAARPGPDAALDGPGPWLYVKVEDTGRGIPADRLASIFEPFVQVDAGRTNEVGGSGLGLAISRRLARLMGGDLTVRSTPDVETTFLLWLACPWAERPNATGGAPPSPARRG